MPARIGVLGGTFDPIHIGHLVAAVDARAALDLDRVLLVVANRPWQKAGTRTITPAPDRIALVEACVAGIDGLEASSVEIDRGGDSYTVDTMHDLSDRHPGAELFLILGADVVGDLHTWVRHEELHTLCELVVVNRPGWEVVEPRGKGWRVHHVEIPALDVSGSDIRRRIAEGRPIDFLVPPGGVHCIRERRLYASSPR